MNARKRLHCNQPAAALTGLRPGTSEQIRLLVSELPRRPDLELALAICLALLEREPANYPRAPARWGRWFALERNLPLVGAQLAFAAIAVLPGEGGRAGAEA